VELKEELLGVRVPFHPKLFFSPVYFSARNLWGVGMAGKETGREGASSKRDEKERGGETECACVRSASLHFMFCIVISAPSSMHPPLY